MFLAPIVLELSHSCEPVAFYRALCGRHLARYPRRRSAFGDVFLTPGQLRRLRSEGIVGTRFRYKPAERWAHTRSRRALAWPMWKRRAVCVAGVGSRSTIAAFFPMDRTRNELRQAERWRPGEFGHRAWQAT